MVLDRSERLENLLAELGAAWFIAQTPQARRRASRRMRLADWVLAELDEGGPTDGVMRAMVNREREVKAKVNSTRGVQ